MIKFEWDSNKAASNRKKHGISFEEAQSVFYDDFAVQFFDEDSVSEDRFLMLGMSRSSNIDHLLLRAGFMKCHPDYIGMKSNAIGTSILSW
ncbi:BrnT family toxin [Nitrosomonas sp.]|uniref:BrnT family toxin n=1 Tax=Nitrosomonas sp. TaxID=42353 RepID=UPI003418BC96